MFLAAPLSQSGEKAALSGSLLLSGCSRSVVFGPSPSRRCSRGAGAVRLLRADECVCAKARFHRARMTCDSALSEAATRGKLAVPLGESESDVRRGQLGSRAGASRRFFRREEVIWRSTRRREARRELVFESSGRVARQSVRRHREDASCGASQQTWTWAVVVDRVGHRAPQRRFRDLGRALSVAVHQLPLSH